MATGTVNSLVSTLNSNLTPVFDTVCSYNTNVVSGGSPRYHKFGRVVVVSIDIALREAVSTNNVTLVSNLPNAGGSVWISLTGYNDNKSYRVRVVGTEIKTHYSNTLPAQTYNGYAVYIATA